MTTRLGRKCTVAFRRDLNGLIWPHYVCSDLERVRYDEGTMEWSENGYFLTPEDYDAAIREAEEMGFNAGWSSAHDRCDSEFTSDQEDFAFQEWRKGRGEE